MHVSGHGYAEEIKQMYNWTKPYISIPVHGEPMHLASHKKISEASQVPVTKILQNGKGGYLFNVGNYKREISVRDISKLFVKLTNNLLKKKIRIVYKKSKDKHYLSDNPRRRKTNIN